MSTLKHNQDLMIRLVAAQNHPANINQDICTFCAFFETRAQLESHVEHYEKQAAEYVAPKKRRRA